jgi:hypothetical protein
MSMSQANAALVMDVYAETARLGITLTEAERVVDQSARRMGQKIDGSFAQIGTKMTKMLSGAIGAGLAIKVIDDALRKVADGIREGKGARAIGEAVAEGVLNSLKAIPVAGALGDIISQYADPLMGGFMELEAGRVSAAAMQQAQRQAIEQAPEFMRQLQIMGLEGPERTKIEREQYIARVEALMERAKVGRVQTVDGKEQELVPGTLQEIALARSRAIAAFDVEVNSRMLKEEEARQERLSTHQRKLEEESLRQQEEKQRKMREDAKAANEAAIAALEQQLQVAEQAIAPTRAERLASIAAGMTGGIATADTALGAFTFAMGDPTQISRNILENAQKQLAALERIEGIQREIAELQKGTGFN